MIRLLGPGCPPAPARIPLAKQPQVLILAVELHKGVPTWVMDSAQSVPKEARRLPGERYPLLYDTLRPGEKVQFECGCRAGRSCRQHDAAAAMRWWVEAQRRDTVREWWAEIGMNQHLSPDAERPKCVTREHAEGEAQQLSRPFAVCRDGWGNEIERWGVERCRT